MKRIVILCLAAIMSTSMITGCGGKKDKEAVSKNEKIEKAAVLKHLGPYDKFDVNTDPTAKALEELTGQKVEYVTLPAEQANEKLNLEIAGGAKYNSIKLYRQQFDVLMGKNVLLDIKPILDKYGKNLLECISKESWASVTVDGKIYGIPEKNSANNINSSIFVRKDILDKYGIPVPKTTDDFLNACRQLKVKGLKSPAAIDQKVSHCIIGAFGLSQEWNNTNGKLVYRGEDENFKKYLNYMNTMYTEGLLGQDWATLNFNTSQERFINGDSAFIVSAWWSGKGIFDALKSKGGVAKPEEAVAFIPTLVGPDGKQGVHRDKGIGFVIGIPKYMEKNAIQTIQWMDKKVEAEVFKKFALGQEGYHYTVKGGKYFPNLEKNDAGKIKFDEKNNASWYLTGSREEDYAKYWQARVRKTPENYFCWDAINKEVDKYGVYNPLGFAPNIDSLSKNRQALDTSVGNFVIQYVTGKNKDFDKYIKELKSNNIDLITKDVNNYYTTVKK